MAAQTIPPTAKPDTTQLFNQAAAKHRRELNNLMNQRGASQVRLSGLTVAKIMAVLAAKNHEEATDATYPEQTGILFYAYENDTLQTWLVTADGIQAYHHQQIQVSALRQAIANLRAALNVDSLQQTRIPHPRGIQVVKSADAKPPEDRAIAQVTQLLLPAPIATQLALVKHLIVVPVLDLGTVPYAILQPFQSKTLLVEKMSVAIAPSLFDVGQTIAPWYPQFATPMVVGNPFLPVHPNWEVPPLPGAEQEAKAVGKLLQATPILGKAATKAAIVPLAPKADFLYFASHGIASSDNPLTGGFLMLSAPTLDQGWWTAREIQQTRLQAQIAVLSACQTGLGQTHDAGIIGLARAFQLAGVPRVVMSLWSVDDAATNELMQSFVKHLATEIPAEALRQAMLETKVKRPTPAQWASFVLFGTPR